MSPGDLVTIMGTSGLYGPVRVAISGTLYPDNIVGIFRDTVPAIVISNVQVCASWNKERLSMIYIVTPTQFGWTWRENVR